jgi:hypothetical protein
MPPPQQVSANPHQLVKASVTLIGRQIAPFGRPRRDPPQLTAGLLHEPVTLLTSPIPPLGGAPDPEHPVVCDQAGKGAAYA